LLKDMPEYAKLFAKVAALLAAVGYQSKYTGDENAIIKSADKFLEWLQK